MAAHAHSFSRPESPRRSLVVRGGLARTFGSLACFLSLTLLGMGGYILTDAFADPIAAQAGAVVGAAFIIALASIILFFLFKPRGKLRVARIKYWERGQPHSRSHGETPAPLEIHNADIQIELPYPRPAGHPARVRL